MNGSGSNAFEEREPLGATQLRLQLLHKQLCVRVLEQREFRACYDLADDETKAGKSDMQDSIWARQRRWMTRKTVAAVGGGWSRVARQSYFGMRLVDLKAKIWATRGVTLSTSAFLACHQCYCAGSSLAQGFNLRVLVSDIF